MARYVAFEGGEGSGKSTQAARLADRLGAVLTREPGGTPLGIALLAMLLDGVDLGAAELDSRAEALLMTADRAQHLADIVLPALGSGRDVVSDRSAYSTLAYQGYGRGVSVDSLRAVCDFACFGRWPDLVVLVDVPVDVGFARLGADKDRLEKAGLGFHQRVRDGFLSLAATEPHRWLVVDGTASADEVERDIVQGVADRAS